MPSKLSVAVVVALLLFSIAVNLFLKKDPFIPTHAEEWGLLAYAKEMQEQHAVIFFDHITGGMVAEEPHYRLEINYLLFVLSLLNLSGIDLFLLPFVLTVIFSLLLSLASFVLVREFTKDNLAAFIAGVFVFGLKNNAVLLGYGFMAPMAFGLAMVPLLVYAFLKGLYSNRHFLVFSILTINTFFSQPVYAFLMVPAALVFFLFKPKIIIKNFPKVFALSLVVFGFAMLALGNLAGKNFSETVLGLLVFPYDRYIGLYPLIGFFHPIEFLAIVLGLAVLLVFGLPGPGWLREWSSKIGKELSMKFSPEANFSIFVLIFSLVWLYLRAYSDINKVCFFGSCRGTSTGLAVVLLMVAGIGFFFLYKIVLETVFKARERIERLLNVLAAIVLAALLLQYVFATGFHYKKEIYNVIDKSQLPDLEWIKKLPQASIVLAPEMVPMAIALVAEKKTPGEREGLGGFSLAEEEFNPAHKAGLPEKNPVQEIGYFFSQGCEEQKAIIKKYSITHAYWSAGTDCVLADKIFDGGNWHVSKLLE